MLFRKTSQQIHPRITSALSDYFSSPELAALSKYGTVVDYPAGRALTVEGEAAREAMMLLDGNIQVTQGGCVVAHAGPGSFFGEMGVCEREARSTGTETLEPVAALVFSARDFDTMLYLFPAIRSAVETAMYQPTPVRVIIPVNRQPIAAETPDTKIDNMAVAA